MVHEQNQQIATEGRAGRTGDRQGSPAAVLSSLQPQEIHPAAVVRLILWDLKADKELVQLPTHPRNSVLDDWETQWTPNGRYLCYWDVEEAATEGQADRPRFRAVIRIWDRQAGKLLRTMQDAVPVGPGPAPSMMVMAKRTSDGSGGFLLHDVSSGKEYPLGDASKNLIHACGGKVIYAERTAGSDSEGVFTADLVIPETAE